MGVYIEKENDADLYKDLYDEVQRLIRASDEIIVSVEKAPKKEKTDDKKDNKKNIDPAILEKGMGFCVRTGLKIPFKLKNPLVMKPTNQIRI
jgi:hypothetical protein